MVTLFQGTKNAHVYFKEEKDAAFFFKQLKYFYGWQGELEKIPFTYFEDEYTLSELKDAKFILKNKEDTVALLKKLKNYLFTFQEEWLTNKNPQNGIILF